MQIRMFRGEENHMRSAPLAAAQNNGQAAEPQLGLGLRDMIENAPGPALLIDTAGRIVAHNAAADALVINAAALTVLERLALAVQVDGRSRASEVTIQAQPAHMWHLSLWPVKDEQGHTLVWAFATDLTVRDRLIGALKDSRAMYKALVEASGDFSWATDAEGRFSFVSSRGAFGYEPWALNGRFASEFGSNAAASFCAHESKSPTDVWLHGADGALVCLSVSAVPVFDEGGAWTGARGIARDVTESRLATQKLDAIRRREQLARRIVDMIRAEVRPGQALKRAVECIAQALEADSCRLLWRMGEVSAGAMPEDVESPVRLQQACRIGEQINGELIVERAHGAWLDEDGDLLSRLADHVAIAIEQSAQHLELERLSLTDSLTGLANRRAFDGEVGRRIASLSRSGGLGVLMVIDLDNFKTLNDSFGHAAGDRALAMLGTMLTTATRGHDVVARIGGDEFSVWLEGCTRSGAERVAMTLRQNIAAQAVLEMGLTLSIGMAALRGPGDDLTALFKRADAALYRVKRAGRDGAQWFEQEDA